MLVYLLLLLGLWAGILLYAGILFGVWCVSLLVLAAGWHRRKRWLMWVGAVPFTLLTLAWILVCLVFFG